MPNKVVSNIQPVNGAHQTAPAEKILLRSPAMQQLISNKRDFMTRWSLLIFFSTFMVLLACTWLIKYPDTIKGSAILNASEETHHYVSAMISQADFSKIRIGQRVQLRFDAYPYQEFGFVEGSVAYISSIPTKSGFQVNIKLTSDLITNLNKEIPNKSGLKAQAIIVTHEARLLERLFFF